MPKYSGWFTLISNNSSNPDVLQIVRRGMDLFLPSERMKTVMKDKKVVAARRQPQNVKSLLFRPRFETNSHHSCGSVLPCRKDASRGKTRGRPCKCCDAIRECNSFCFEGSSEPFELRFHFTCDTKNVLYLVTCLGCGLDYIGKTEREVRERCSKILLKVSINILPNAVVVFLLHLFKKYTMQIVTARVFWHTKVFL